VVEAQLDGIRETIEQISVHVHTLSVHVHTLSETSIKDWKTRCDGAVRRTASLNPA